MRLVLENHSSKEVARRLGISQTSVDTHVRNARAKLGVRDRYEAARLLQAWELASPPPPGASPAATIAAPAPASAAPASPSERRPLLRPLEELSFADRLLLIVGCAIAAALVFGLLLPAFAAL